MAESIILDASEVATAGRTSFDLTPYVASAGPDWGDAQMLAYLSELSVGSSPVDYRIPNRQITIPLSIRDVGNGTTFAAARSAIQTKIGQWQNGGGWIKRVTANGGTVFCDVVSAQLRLSGDFLQARATSQADINASISLEAIPDFYAAEETLSDHTETTAAELIFTETTTNGGDFPLGDRVRIVVDEDQGQNQRGLVWGIRCRHYSSAATAALAYEAEALQPLDTAARAAKVGASGGTIVTHGTISTNWTPVLGTNIGGTTYLTHQGTYRAWARVFTTSGTTVQARFVYDVNDLVYPTENSAVRCYDGGTFHVLNLGEVRLVASSTGTYRWQGQVQAIGDAGGENFSVDRVWLQPVEETPVLATSSSALVQGLSTFAARDGFDQTSGNLDAPKAAPVGGNWSESTRTGANGFQTSGVGTLTRTTVSDADGLSGSYAVLGSAMTSMAVQVDLKFSAVGSGEGQGVLARYVDASNWLFGYLGSSGTGGVSLGQILVGKRIAGTFTLMASTPLVANWGALNTNYRVALSVDTAGNWAMYALANATAQVSPLLILSGYDSVLATGGALASGKAGIYDEWPNATASTRTYDNFAAWVPNADAAIFASRSTELNTLGITRQDAGGTAYGPVSVVNGDLPRLPNRAAGGTTEVFIKTSRGDFTGFPDPAIDDLSARVYRRASYLLVP